MIKACYILIIKNGYATKSIRYFQEIDMIKSMNSKIILNKNLSLN